MEVMAPTKDYSDRINARPGQGLWPSRLRLGNVIVGIIHLVQAAVILTLSNDFTLPMNASFLSGPPGSDLSAREVIWNIPVGQAISVFLLLAAVDHLLMALPGINTWYNNNLRRGVNYARWSEYSVSASIMIVLIAMVTGVSDVGALVAIFGANAAMILFGLLMERMNPNRGRTDWTAFLFGCIVGIVPWMIIAYHVAGAENRATGSGVPTFVYGIIASLFVLFNSFAVNMVLQYRQTGRWRNYIFGEQAYIVLSLVAKSALAWQVFANTLIG